MPRTINLRGIPEDLFRDFKIACVTNDTDMSNALKSLMGDYIRSGGKVTGRGAVKMEQSDKSGIKQAGPRKGSKNGKINYRMDRKHLESSDRVRQNQPGM